MNLNLEKVKKAYEKKHGPVGSTVALGEKLGVSHTTLYKWRRGEGLQSMEYVQNIMKLTGLEFKQIFKK